jgi:tetratricopeptide (TPR) repeat protein
MLFRPQLASALVTRGDDLLRAGETESALAAYRRALRFAPHDPVATDRLAFTLLLRRADGDAAQAFAAAEAGLHDEPRSAALRADRGLAAARLGRWPQAERDFRAAADAAHDPRYAHLAARMAQRAHDLDRARADLAVAIAIDPTYLPARALRAKLAR